MVVVTVSNVHIHVPTTVRNANRWEYAIHKRWKKEQITTWHARVAVAVRSRHRWHTHTHKHTAIAWIGNSHFHPLTRLLSPKWKYANLWKNKNYKLPFLHFSAQKSFIHRYVKRRWRRWGSLAQAFSLNIYVWKRSSAHISWQTLYIASIATAFSQSACRLPRLSVTFLFGYRIMVRGKLMPQRWSHSVYETRSFFGKPNFFALIYYILKTSSAARACVCVCKWRHRLCLRMQCIFFGPYRSRSRQRGFFPALLYTQTVSKPPTIHSCVVFHYELCVFFSLHFWQCCRVSMAE